MNIKLFCATLGVCLSVASTAMGQAQQPTPGGNNAVPPVPQQNILAVQDHYIAQPTPEQQAVEEQIGQLNHAAAVALHAGRYAEVETDARRFMMLSPMSGVADELLAQALDAQGKEQEALLAYQEVVEHTDVHPRNLLPYALLLLKTGHWAQAVEAYNKALPNLANGELVRANSHFSPAMLEPTALAIALHIALGLTNNWECDWAGNPQHDKALKEYTKALQLAPDSDLANFYYAYGLQRLGRRVEAQAAFKKAAALGNDDVKAAAEKELR